jgi:hypothetical protein
MSGGTISGNTASSSGGGVYNNGTFTMNAGAIINGNTAGGGGGVSNSGTFTMNNGTISGNTASSYAGFSDSVRAYGGGVHINMGTFEMRSGTINGNSATSSVSSWGGGVSVSGSSGEFKKTGNGIIYGNNAIPEALKNSASGNGDALYKVSSSKKRNSTIPAGMTFNSNSETGWE